MCVRVCGCRCIYIIRKAITDFLFQWCKASFIDHQIIEKNIYFWQGVSSCSLHCCVSQDFPTKFKKGEKVQGKVTAAFPPEIGKNQITIDGGVFVARYCKNVVK